MDMCDICDNMWKHCQLLGTLLNRENGIKKQGLLVNASIKLRFFKITLDIKKGYFSDTSFPSSSVTL